MQDRLRKLDALFAEKVLGLEPIADTDMTAELRTRYTRSLDAAWDGVVSMYRNFSIECEHPEKEHSCRYPHFHDSLWDNEISPQFPDCFGIELGGEGYVAYAIRKHNPGRDGDIEVSIDDGIEAQFEAPHPAEALVLACLRAVGVREEELK